MKYILAFWVAFLATPVFGQDISEREHEALNELFHRLNQGYETLDASVSAGTYANSGLFVTAGADHPVGTSNKELESWVFGGWFEAMKKAGQYARIKFRVAARERTGDDTITDAGYWRIETFSKETDKILGTSYGKFLNIYRRAENGEWQNWADAYETNADSSHWDAAQPVTGAEFHRD